MADNKEKKENHDQVQTIVVKIGSASLSTEDGFLDIGVICRLVEVLCKLRRLGHNVVLVTSGAVSVGAMRMGLKDRPTKLTTKQAIAAVGQSRLMRVYDDFFSNFDQPIAQVLLTRENLNMEHHYQNSYNTLKACFELGVVPIVNENDTVAVEELRFGDNDTLSALVASLIEADKLVLLTDVDALYTADPRSDPSAERIAEVNDISKLDVNFGSSGKWGTGGMATKVSAAVIGVAAGVRTVVCHSANPECLIDIVTNGGKDVGTHFVPKEKVVKGTKKWLAHGLHPTGGIVVDDGAVKALRRKKSLFAAGIVSVTGTFGDAVGVAIFNTQKEEVARGLVNYSAVEISKILGKPSSQLSDLLGYSGPAEVIHRSNLVLS